MLASKNQTKFESQPIRKQYFEIWINFYMLTWQEIKHFKLGPSLSWNLILKFALSNHNFEMSIHSIYSTKCIEHSKFFSCNQSKSFAQTKSDYHSQESNGYVIIRKQWKYFLTSLMFLICNHREHPLMTSHIFWPFLTYLPTCPTL